MRKIAFIAAFPPPITGQSLAADLLKNGLQDEKTEIFELDLAEPIDGESLSKRLYHLAKVEGRLFYLCVKHGDMIVYMQLGHGKLALLRDLIFMMTAMITKHPCHGHVHGSGFRKAFDSLPKPIRWIEKKCISHLASAVVLSDSLRNMFLNLLDDNKIYAVDNGIDPDFVALTMDKMPSEKEPKNILFLSNFITKKGFSTLLETAKLAQEANKNWVFYFYGQKIERQDVDIDSYIQQNDLHNVTVHDVVEGQKKHEAYCNADVFVLPSLYEGQPLCILEALFESLPVITTKVGGIPEIFSDETGVRYVTPNDPMGLYHQIDAIFSNSNCLNEMGTANRKLALTRFTAEKHISRMKEILFAQSDF